MYSVFLNPKIFKFGCTSPLLCVLIFCNSKRQTDSHTSGSSVSVLWIKLGFIQAVLFGDLELKMIARQNERKSSATDFVKVQLCALYVKDDTSEK